jgi:sugar O-acyltransferase (sialic acid O-acetyltransferase NeuD family)
MKEIVVYGAGGHGFAVMELINLLGEFKPVAVYDDHPKHRAILGVPVQQTPTITEAPYMCITIGNNSNRKKVVAGLRTNFPNFIHPRVCRYPSLVIGKGNVILPNAVLDAAVTVGDFCIVNNNATLSHNVTLEDFVHVAINAAVSGGVSIGEGALIGAGSVILPELKIGKWAVVGAGAVVTKNVPDYAVVYGNPAIIKGYQTNHE